MFFLFNNKDASELFFSHYYIYLINHDVHGSLSSKFMWNIFILAVKVRFIINWYTIMFEFLNLLKFDSSKKNIHEQRK